MLHIPNHPTTQPFNNILSIHDLDRDLSDSTDRSRSRSSITDANRPLRDAEQDLYRVQIQPTNQVLDHADHTAPTRQHDELDRTDHTDHTYNGSICPERSRSSSGNRSYRSSTRGVKYCKAECQDNVAELMA